VRAFDTGRSRIHVRHDVTVKLDGDLFLPPHYFAWVAETFARDERAGIVGGVVLVREGGQWRPESTGHVVGAVKAYRTTCLDDIGGLRPSMGWDGIVEYAARARGWHVWVLSELSVLHFERRGSKEPWLRARWEEGRGNHYMGYSTPFLVVRALYRMATEEPPVLGGLMLAAGFLAARVTRAARVDDPGAVALLRQEQRARLKALLRGRADLPLPSPPGAGPAFWATEGRRPTAPSSSPTPAPLP
jgi:hypothetical protein